MMMNQNDRQEPRRHARAIMALFALVVTLFVLLAPRGSAAQTAPKEGRLWIEVRDQRGQVVRDLAASDLEILIGGALLDPTGLEPEATQGLAQSAEPSRFVVWFDLPTAGKGTVTRAAQGLAGLARELTALGEVDLVMAGDATESVLSGRDELVLAERLRWTATNNPGEGQLLEIRDATLTEALRLKNAPSTSAQEVAQRVAAGIEEEIEVVRERQNELMAWLGAVERRGPRVVLLVTDGFDLDPLAFYNEHLDEETWRIAARESRGALMLESSVRTTAQTLAALGWIVVPVAIEAPSGAADDLAPTLIETTGRDVEGSTGAGITLRPGSLFRRRDRTKEEAPATPTARFVDASGPLTLLAAASGGETVTSERGLRDALTRFGRRYGLRYDLPLGAGDVRSPGGDPGGTTQSLEVRARRGGLTVNAPRWWSRAVPEALVELRLGRLLRGFPNDGELDVAAVLRLEGDSAIAPQERLQGALEARLQLRDLYGEDERPRDASFRVTVAMAVPGGEPRFEREIVLGQNLTGLQEWQYLKTLDMPAEASEVAVMVEPFGYESWGGTRAGLVSAAEAVAAPAVIEIERPEEELLRGRTRFAVKAFDNRIGRVAFELDERQVAEATRRPFTARINLGRSPRRQTLTVIAFDARGEEMGRDTVILNAGSGGLEIKIIRPETFQGTGNVDVEASVAVPVKRRLDRVLFFWNSTPVATLFAPPFRQRIYIPPEQPVGYVRTVAMLDDGTVAEDVAFMNGPDAGERIDVNLVELYVVVTSKGGRPVRGLTQADFRIREEGKEQEISTFSDASDLPLTLGMAIDSSASMFVKLPIVQRAAIRFLRSTFGEQDRAFVVDFDSQPRLVRSTTARLDSVERSIESLQANGRTALWESIVYSLVQLQGVRGRKALVVFSDGADEDDKFPFSSCMSFARKMGVPIYLILMKKTPKANAGLSLISRSFKTRVDRLVSETGGRVFYAREYTSLDNVYRQIEIELRSQYLLAYYPTLNGGRSAWRDVDVDILQKDLIPRTLSGYWQ